jgi:hypothetical protein
MDKLQTVTLDRRTSPDRRAQPVNDTDLTVECAGCDARPLASVALGVMVTQPGAVRPSPTTYFCPRCTSRFGRCWYAAMASGPDCA